MVDANRYYFQSLNEEWIQIYVVEPECRRPWIGILFEAVIKPLAQGFRHVWFEKYRQWFGGAERSEVVESANMVGVAVGYKQRIDRAWERKSGEASINKSSPCVCTMTDDRKRLSCRSEDEQISQPQPISGTPLDVPLPSTVTLMELSM